MFKIIAVTEDGRPINNVEKSLIATHVAPMTNGSGATVIAGPKTLDYDSLFDLIDDTDPDAICVLYMQDGRPQFRGVLAESFDTFFDNLDTAVEIVPEFQNLNMWELMVAHYRTIEQLIK